jgi:hypothetical protein
METINPETVSSQISSFSSNKYIDATQEFLESNSIVAKVTFLLFALFLYMMLFRIGMMIIMYFYGPSSVQKLVDGIIPGNSRIIISQDPKVSGSQTIYRSNNQVNGIEFTWSVWLNINKDTLDNPSDKYKHIFHKGNESKDAEDLYSPNNAPGLYISPLQLTSTATPPITTTADDLELTVVMTTFENYNEQIKISNIPLNKWFNVIIRCKNTLLDVYVNGSIAKSTTLTGVPKQNFGDIYVTNNNGFNGQLADLLYYSNALGIADIQSIMAKGPSTYAAKISGSGGLGLVNTSANYLSTQWYFDGLSI